MSDFEFKMFISDRKITNFMELVDLRDPGVWYGSFGTATLNKPLTKNKAISLMKDSRTQKEFYVPAIFYKDELIFDDNVTAISDGKYRILNPKK